MGRDADRRGHYTKGIIAVGLVLTLLVSSVVLIAADDRSDAAETLAEVPEGWIGIYSAEDFAKIGYDAEYPTSGKYIQMADIVFTIQLTPPTVFTGQYDGNGHTITDLMIEGSTYSVGLFARLFNASLTDISLINANVNGTITSSGTSLFIGAITGSTSGVCSITNCMVSGTVNGVGISSSASGGIVGSLNSESTIENCYTDASVIATSQASQNDLTTAGGIVGNGASANGSIVNCYAVGSVSATDAYGGGYRGAISGIDGSLTSCYSLAGSTALMVGYRGILDGDSGFKTDAELKEQSTYVDWDFDNTWGIIDGYNEGYPFLQSSFRPAFGSDVVEYCKWTGEAMTHTPDPLIPGYTITLSGTASTFLSYDSDTGNITGTTPQSVGLYELNVNALYVLGTNQYASLQVVYIDVLAAPGFVEHEITINAVVGTEVEYVTQLTDGYDSISVSGNGLVSEGGFLVWEGGSLTLIGTPEGMGTYTVTIAAQWTVNGNVQTDEQIITVTVSSGGGNGGNTMEFENWLYFGGMIIAIIIGIVLLNEIWKTKLPSNARTETKNSARFQRTILGILVVLAFGFAIVVLVAFGTGTLAWPWEDVEVIVDPVQSFIASL